MAKSPLFVVDEKNLMDQECSTFVDVTPETRKEKERRFSFKAQDDEYQQGEQESEDQKGLFMTPRFSVNRSKKTFG